MTPLAVFLDRIESTLYYYLRVDLSCADVAMAEKLGNRVEVGTVNRIRKDSEIYHSSRRNQSVSF